MSNRRAIWWMAVVLVLTVLAHLGLDLGGKEVMSVRQRTMVAPLADRADEISISVESCPTIKLVNDGGWRLTSPFAALADSEAVRRLTDVLAFTPVADVYPERELLKDFGRGLDDFGLQTPQIRVELHSPSGNSKFALGNPAPLGTDCRYASIDGLKAVFVVPTAVYDAVNRSPDSFRRRELFNDNSIEVREIVFKTGDSAYSRYLRDESGNWNCLLKNGKTWVKASAEHLGEAIDTLENARAINFVWPTGATNEPQQASVAMRSGYGLDAESCTTVTLKGADGRERSVSLGKAARDGCVYALVQNASAVVTLPSSVKTLLTKGDSYFTDSRLFPYAASAVNQIAITDGDVEYRLARESLTGWHLDSPVVASADPLAVSSLLNRILSLDAADLTEGGPKVSVASNATPVAVSRQALLGNSRFVDLRSRTILAIEPESVSRLVQTVAAEDPVVRSVVYDRNTHRWSVETSAEEGVPDSEAIAGILKLLGSFTADQVIALKAGSDDLKGYGLYDPEYKLAVDSVIPELGRKNIQIGKLVPGVGRYVTVGAYDAVFMVSGEKVERLTAPLVK